jgi:hypothetical protein
MQIQLHLSVTNTANSFSVEIKFSEVFAGDKLGYFGLVSKIRIKIRQSKQFRHYFLELVQLLTF